MADQNSNPSPRSNQTTPLSYFFGSPRFFNGFLAKGISNSETITSPTSILNSKNVPNFGIPFGYDQNLFKSTENKHINEILHSTRNGLALIDSLNDEKSHDKSNSKPNPLFSMSNFSVTKPKISGKVLFRPKLKIQIPSFPPSSNSTAQSPKSPADFGIKTRNSQFLSNSSPLGGLNSGVQTKDHSPNISTGGLSLSEMELSEEYTCVISHGPNPKTTRIYENCVVESCCGVVALSDLKKEFNMNSPSQSFLNFCHTCKKNLGGGKDIYIYRGEKAFCSNKCRCEEMFLEGLKNSELDNGF